MKYTPLFAAFALSLSFIVSNFTLHAQCPFPSMAFGSATAPSTPGTYVYVSMCSFPDEYTVVDGVQAGTTYSVSYSGGSGDMVVVYDDNFSPVVWGTSPVEFMATNSGTYYSSCFISPNCGTDFSCNDALWANLISNSYEEIVNCGSYTWALNNQTYASSGVYIDSILVSGTYQTHFLELTVIPLNLGVLNSQIQLFSEQNGAAYQWIDCSTNLPILGATSQEFTVPQNGSYAVIVTNGVCTDTSDCYSAILELESLEKAIFSIAPNPAKEFVNISFEGENAQLEIIDGSGKTLYLNEVENGDQINLSHFDSGLYFFNFQTSEKKEVQRVIRE